MTIPVNKWQFLTTGDWVVERHDRRRFGVVRSDHGRDPWVFVIFRDGPKNCFGDLVGKTVASATVRKLHPLEALALQAPDQPDVEEILAALRRWKDR
jgi:hypothetical protein